MKTNFKFDKKTGTMVASKQLEDNQPSNEIHEKEDDTKHPIPVIEQKKIMDVKQNTANAMQSNVLQMVRVNKLTPIQLVNENGIPEAYLDSVTAGVMMFRERQDYDIYQIVDERTGKPLAYIGGYALQISFDMSELNSMEKIEQCLNGMTKMFRKFIMEQALNR